MKRLGEEAQMEWEIEIRHLYRSDGHRFVGRHGKQPLDFPMTVCEQIECISGKGIVGDRYFDYRRDYKGQLTLFSYEVFQDLNQHFGIDDRGPQVFRRNVIVSGVDLNRLIGRTFRIGGVELSGVEEAKPCYWMNQAYCEGAEAWLRGLGGLRARILTDGELTLGRERLEIVE